MVRIALVLLVVTAAQIASAAPRRPRCPARIEAFTRRAWHLPAGTSNLRVLCVGGRFGEPGLFLSARYEVPGEDATLEATGIVSVDGRRELVEHDGGPMTPAVEDYTGATYRAADLDGDGVDELVAESEDSRHGFLRVTANVIVVQGSTLDYLDGPLVQYSDAAADPRHDGSVEHCDGALSIEHDRIVIRIKHRSKGAPEGCLAPGRHTFALRGGAVVET